MSMLSALGSRWRLRDRRGSSTVELTVTLPISLLVFLFGINLIMASTTAMLSIVAASHAVREASVQQTRAAAVAAARQVVDNMVGPERSMTLTGGHNIGEEMTVTVDWEMINLFGGLTALYGGSGDMTAFTGNVHATARREGW